MIKRITNFANNESQMIDWNDNIPKNCTIGTFGTMFKLEELQELMTQFNLLISIYPEALEDEVILKDFEKLKKYAKENKVALQDLYTYQNKVVFPSSLAGSKKYANYGIRIVPSIYLDEPLKTITITEYTFMANRELLSKYQFNIKTQGGRIIDKNMISTDSTTNFSYDKRALDGLTSRQYIKR